MMQSFAGETCTVVMTFSKHSQHCSGFAILAKMIYQVADQSITSHMPGNKTRIHNFQGDNYTLLSGSS